MQRWIAPRARSGRSGSSCSSCSSFSSSGTGSTKTGREGGVGGTSSLARLEPALGPALAPSRSPAPAPPLPPRPKLARLAAALASLLLGLSTRTRLRSRPAVPGAAGGASLQAPATRGCFLRMPCVGCGDEARRLLGRGGAGGGGRGGGEGEGERVQCLKEGSWRGDVGAGAGRGSAERSVRGAAAEGGAVEYDLVLAARAKEGGERVRPTTRRSERERRDGRTERHVGRVKLASWRRVRGLGRVPQGADEAASGLGSLSDEGRVGVASRSHRVEGVDGEGAVLGHGSVLSW